MAGPRSIGFLDPSGARRSRDSELPETAPGAIRSFAVAGDAFVVSTGIGEPGRQTDGRTAVVGLDGSIRCEGPAGGPLFSLYRAGSMWTQDLRFRLDPATCAVSPGLAPRGQRRPSVLPRRGIQRLPHRRWVQPQPLRPGDGSGRREQRQAGPANKRRTPPRRRNLDAGPRRDRSP